ncbi:MAG TPA: hypothetical protein VJU82_17550 [Acidobacteriaceae bacterium]|nr:hypothetical protein [Acidobacteriaceae bacterium]
MYRVTVSCAGIAPDAGVEGAADIEQDFRDHRAWHSKPECSFADGVLTLVVENDFDADGQATLDEFADSVVASIGEHGALQVTNVRTV